MHPEPSRDPGLDSRPTATTRRHLLARGATAAAVVGLAGCSGPRVQAVTRSLSEDTGGLTSGEYEQFVADSRDRYGESGVRGGDSGGYEHLEFVRAWTGSFGVDGEDPVVASDHVLALYRVSGKVDTAGREYFRLWQWSGARVSDPGGMRSPVVQRLSNRVQFPQGRVDLLSYAPAGTRSGDRTVTVGMTDPSAAGPAGTVPLHGGSTGPGESRVGSGGQFGVRWSGRSAPVQSVAGACSLRRPPDVDLLVDWTLEVQAGTPLL